MEPKVFVRGVCNNCVSRVECKHAEEIEEISSKGFCPDFQRNSSNVLKKKGGKNMEKKEAKKDKELEVIKEKKAKEKKISTEKKEELKQQFVAIAKVLKDLLGVDTLFVETYEEKTEIKDKKLILNYWCIDDNWKTSIIWCINKAITLCVEDKDKISSYNKIFNSDGKTLRQVLDKTNWIN